MNTQPRSPNYPRVSLAKILSRLKKYQPNINTNIQTQEAIAHALGFTGVTGASLPILSALKKFKLLEAHKEGFKFSDTTFKAMALTADDSQYADLIERIAFEPSLFFEIREIFGYKFPPLDAFEDFLMLNGFVPKRIPEVIEIYRQTYELVSTVCYYYGRLSEGSATSVEQVRLTAGSYKKSLSAGAVQELQQEWNFDLADGIQIAVKIVGMPSVSAMNKLADFWKHNEHFWKIEEEK